MNEKYERNLEKSFKDFQKRYYSMGDPPPPTDGRPRPTIQVPPHHIRPSIRRSQMSPSTIRARVNSLPIKREQAQEDSAMARADATNAGKKQIEAEKRQRREEQSIDLAEETRKDMRKRAEGYDDKIRNIQYEPSVGSGPGLANAYEGGFSKQMSADSVASGRTRQLKPVVPEQARASQSSRQHKAGRRSTLQVEQIPTPRDRPIDLSVSATGAPVRSLTRKLSNLNVNSR